MCFILWYGVCGVGFAVWGLSVWDMESPASRINAFTPSYAWIKGILHQSVQSVVLQNIEDVLNNLIIFIHQRKKLQPTNNLQTIENNAHLSLSVQSVVKQNL